MDDSSPDYARLRVHDPLTGSDFAPGAGIYYRDNFEQRAGHVGFKEGALRDGKATLRLGVSEHCQPGDEECSERAEVWEYPESWAPYQAGIWRGFAVRFVPPIPKDTHRYVIAQWKREIAGAHGNFSPYFALRMRGGHLFATIETNVLTSTDGPGASSWPRPETEQTRILAAVNEGWNPDVAPEYTARTAEIRITPRGAPLPRPSADWIEFAVFTRPGPSGDGRIELFANGGWVMSAEGRIGQGETRLGPRQYFKFGPYRAAAPGDWSLDYADYRRSPRAADVLGRDVLGRLWDDRLIEGLRLTAERE